jgi:FMN phosphatase YigB (HAD superfamily)
MGSEYTIRSEVRVVTFDLDNTLWNTSKTIDAANDALAKFLEADNILQPKRIEIMMGELWQADKSRYAPVDENAKAPVLLTQLRTDAICLVLEEHNGYSEVDAFDYAQKAFNVWTKARHDAAPQNFASSVLTCLEKIASIRTSMGHPVLIGAITDGNSDPRNIEELRGFFDFCVNAESIGVGKPDKRVYHEAIRHVGAHPSFADLSLRSMEDEDALESFVGPYWVHIGDDFIKDVVAAKSLNMRSIWATELVRDKLEASRKSEDGKTVGGKRVEDFVKEIANLKSIDMSVGADFYLADSLQEEFVDAVAEEFDHLAEILLGWHEEGRGSNDAPVISSPEAGQDSTDTPTKLEIKSASKTSVSLSADENPLSVVMPNTPSESRTSEGSKEMASDSRPRAFRLIREECNMDVPAPLLDRATRNMKDILTLAQRDKSSGVFSFLSADVDALREGKMTLMVKVVDADLEFSREIFTGMTVQEVLSLTDKNPVTLTLSMKKSVESVGFDLF